MRLLVALLLAACSPSAWQTRCERYGCKYSEYDYCTGTIACAKQDERGACTRFSSCFEQWSSCTQYRGVTRAELEAHDGARP